MRDEIWFVELYGRRYPAVLRTASAGSAPSRLGRSRSQRASSGIAAGVAAQLDPMSSVDSVIDVRAALGSLSPADQEALLLVEWEGVDHAAGGKITGCSANTFKVRVHRAHQRLAAALASANPAGTTPARTRSSDEPTAY